MYNTCELDKNYKKKLSFGRRQKKKTDSHKVSFASTITTFDNQLHKLALYCN